MQGQERESTSGAVHAPLVEAVGVGVRGARQNCSVLAALGFFFRIILEQKEKLENIRNSDGITYKCDPGLNSNQGVCPVCFQIFDEIQFGSL